MFMDRNTIYLSKTALDGLGSLGALLTVFSGIENHWLRRRARAQVIDGLDLDIVGSIDSRRHHPQGVVCDCFFFPLHWGSLWLPGHSVLQSWSILLHGLQRLQQKAKFRVITDTLDSGKPPQVASRILQWNDCFLGDLKPHSGLETGCSSVSLSLKVNPSSPK